MGDDPVSPYPLTRVSSWLIMSDSLSYIIRGGNFSPNMLGLILAPDISSGKCLCPALSGMYNTPFFTGRSRLETRVIWTRLRPWFARRVYKNQLFGVHLFPRTGYILCRIPGKGGGGILPTFFCRNIL